MGLQQLGPTLQSSQCRGPGELSLLPQSLLCRPRHCLGLAVRGLLSQLFQPDNQRCPTVAARGPRQIAGQQGQARLAGGQPRLPLLQPQLSQPQQIVPAGRRFRRGLLVSTTDQGLELRLGRLIITLSQGSPAHQLTHLIRQNMLRKLC